MSEEIGAVRTVWGRLWARIGTGAFWIGIGIGLAALLFGPCLPFFAAFLLAGAVQRMYRALARRMFGIRQTDYGQNRGFGAAAGVRRFAAAVICVMLCVLGGGAVLFAAVNLIWSELARLFVWLGENTAPMEVLIGRLVDAADGFLARLPFYGEGDTALGASLGASIAAALPDMIGGIAGSISAKASSAVSAVISALPRIVMFLAVFLIAAVYMTVEYTALLAYLRRCLPQKVRSAADRVRGMLGGTLRAMLGAYILLSFVTFLLLLCGLLVLGVERAFGLAVLGALIDILPVFGTGTLLIPWSVLSFFLGHAGRGVGLVVLYLVICFTRQMLEPRLIGKSAGIHPLAALFALYLGGISFGVGGMLAAPFLLSVVWRGYRILGGGHGNAADG